MPSSSFAASDIMSGVLLMRSSWKSTTRLRRLATHVQEVRCPPELRPLPPTPNSYALRLISIVSPIRWRGPTPGWTAQQMVEAFSWETTARYVIRDRIYYAHALPGMQEGAAGKLEAMLFGR